MEKQGTGTKGQGPGGNHARPAIFQFPIFIFRRVGWWLRQVTEDAAYENYLRSALRGRDCTHHPRLMTREEYYLDHLRRRYAGVSRCC
jgi:hypothetical protein